MKVLILVLVFCLVQSIGFSQVSYQLKKETSVLTWESDYVIGGGHHGTIDLSSGYLKLIGDTILQGNFVIDMNSIKNKDEEDETSRRDLEEHLKSADFFDVAQHPKGYFTISNAVLETSDSAKKYKVTGQLRLKGITHSITFPASLEVKTGGLKVYGEAVIDRTKWDVTYNSQTFFSSLKDGAIEDLIKIGIDLTFLVVE